MGVQTQLWQLRIFWVVHRFFPNSLLDLNINHIKGPLGVRGRNSDNNLIKDKLGWAPSEKLYDGLKKTYTWISEQVLKQSLVEV